MIAPQKHTKEYERLKDLDSYSILDTLPEADYDNLTAIAAEICGTPIALVSLIDDKRQWFKSHHGLDATETPREFAFCAHAINEGDDVFVVQDSRSDVRFHDNPLVTGNPHVIFYAGVPLISENNLPLGTLCVIDHEPKSLSEGQISSLTALANQVVNLLKLRKSNAQLEESILRLEVKNDELERFAYVAAHDLKSPLIGIAGLAKLFSSDYGSIIDDKGQKMLDLIEGAADKLRRLIDGLLEYSRSENVLNENKSIINLKLLEKDIYGLFSFDKELKFIVKTSLIEIFANRTALDQILINLVANAIKYNNMDSTEIEIGISENNENYLFYVQDNGPGIEKQLQEKIFNIFEIVAVKDKFGQTGNGIGLATVKKLVEKLGGIISVESDLGKGSKFTFSIEKAISYDI
ncbi:MAG: ATP-binding protein [Paludibacter sp.]